MLEPDSACILDCLSNLNTGKLWEYKNHFDFQWKLKLYRYNTVSWSHSFTVCTLTFCRKDMLVSSELLHAMIRAAQSKWNLSLGFILHSCVISVLSLTLTVIRHYDTLATGIIYFHRFYMFHSFKQFPRYVSSDDSCCQFFPVPWKWTKCVRIMFWFVSLTGDWCLLPFSGRESGRNPKEV